MSETVEEIPKYLLRGHMVERKEGTAIVWAAISCLKTLNINKNTFNIDKIIDILSVYMDITVNVISNKEWEKRCGNLKVAESIPSQKIINIPHDLFKGATKKKYDDLFVFFHELGHVALEHEPLYLKNEGYEVDCLDDAEAQADFFAKICLSILGITDNNQLDLFEDI